MSEVQNTWYEDKSFRRKVRKLGAAIVCSGIVYLVLKYALPVFIPFLAAFFAAYLIYPVTALLKKWFRIPVTISGSVLFLLFCALCVSGIVWLLGLLIDQLAAAVEYLTPYEHIMNRQVDLWCEGLDRTFHLGNGTTLHFVEHGVSEILIRAKNNLLPAITEGTFTLATGVAKAAVFLLVFFVSTILFCTEMGEWKKKYNRLKEEPVIGTILSGFADGGFAYLKTQGILFFIIANVLCIGLSLLGNPYGLLIGVGIAAFDAIPMLGSGLILVPWGIVGIFERDYLTGVVLLVLFAICQIVREVLEPKLLGGKLGIRPVLALMAVYIGIRLFGPLGVFLGPVGLILVRSLLSVF